jgi:hypothetical protein
MSSELEHGAQRVNEVAAKARELYGAAADQKRAAAAANPTLDRRGRPVPHELQPWEKVPGDIQRLWLRKARQVLEQEEEKQ